MDFRFNKSIMLLILFTGTLFINTLWNDFTHDDIQIVQSNRFLSDQWKVTDIFKEGRLMRTASLMVDYKLFGNNPAGYHLQNIIWHTLNTILLYFFIISTARDQKLAIIASLLFASHPLHVESVANVSNRKDLLCFFFMLASLLFFVRSYERIGLKKFPYLFLCLLTFILALLSKQAAVALPLIIIAYDIYFIPKEKRIIIGRNLPYLMPFLISFLIYGSYYLVPSITRFLYSDFSYLNVLLLTMSSFTYYCQLLLWPINLAAEHTVRLIDIRVVLSIFMLGLIILSIIMAWPMQRFLSFGLLWFIINLLPVSNLIPFTANFFIAERYMYIPSAGFVMVIAFILNNSLLYWEKATILLLALIVIFFSMNTVKRNTVWKNDLILWSDNLRKYPDCVFSKIKIADFYQSQGLIGKAIPYYINILKDRPDNAEIRNSLVLSYMELAARENHQLKERKNKAEQKDK